MWKKLGLCLVCEHVENKNHEPIYNPARRVSDDSDDSLQKLEPCGGDHI